MSDSIKRNNGIWHYQDTMYYCSNCGNGFYDISPYCPICGVKMIGNDLDTWIEQYDSIICPICNAEFSDEIYYMPRARAQINHCPNCSTRLKRR